MLPKGHTHFTLQFPHFLGCYKRQEGVSYVYGRVEAQKDSRPNTFYFGNLGSDIDACEAACKDESECVAYTLYKVGDLFNEII